MKIFKLRAEEKIYQILELPVKYRIIALGTVSPWPRILHAYMGPHIFRKCFFISSIPQSDLFIHSASTNLEKVYVLWQQKRAPTKQYELPFNSKIKNSYNNFGRAHRAIVLGGPTGPASPPLVGLD